MSTQTGRRIRVAIFYTIMFWLLDASVAAIRAQATDCLIAPDSPASKNSHWYFRTDRAQQRKCWHLGASIQPVEQGSVQIERGSSLGKPIHSERAKSSYSLASFKEFIKRRKGADLSNEDVEGLYAAFLEWNHRTNN